MKASAGSIPLVWAVPAVHNLACEQEADRVAAGQTGGSRSLCPDAGPAGVAGAGFAGCRDEADAERKFPDCAAVESSWPKRNGCLDLETFGDGIWSGGDVVSDDRRV